MSKSLLDRTAVVLATAAVALMTAACGPDDADDPAPRDPGKPSVTQQDKDKPGPGTTAPPPPGSGLSGENSTVKPNQSLGPS